MAKSKWQQGTYEPLYPEKYKGSMPIVYRSGWERRVFYFLDTHPAIKRWGSESIVIPYRFQVDGKMHRYFIDVDFEVEDKDGNIRRYIIEIKPYEQTLPPKEPKRKTQKAIKRYNNEILTYQKNQDKWKAAEEWARKNGYIFEIWTEKTLGL